VCLQDSVPIDPRDTYGTLADRLQGVGGELLVRTLDENPPCAEQNDALATYAEKITASDRELDPHRSAAELERIVRALTPHIGAHIALPDGAWLGVRGAKVLASPEPPPGVVSFDGARPVLGCAAGALELTVVQPPGRRAMSGEDYLRGRRH
jgi:methionyl-tRNA formyltransferase